MRRRAVEPPLLRGGLAARLAGTLVGYWLLALGTATMLAAHVGLSPWDALHQGLAGISGLSFGVVVVLVGVLAVAIARLLGARIRGGMISNLVLVGVFIEILLRAGAVPSVAGEPLALRLAVFLVGVALQGLAFGVYIAADTGAGPRDALMLVLARRSRVRIAITRNVLEAAVLVLGVLLGGSAGAGTVLAVLLVGPASELGFRALLAVRLARPRPDGARVAA